MRALVVVVASASFAYIAHAQRRVNHLATQPSIRPVRRAPLAWNDLGGPIRPTDAGKWQLGTGVVGGWDRTLPELHLGCHVTDLVLVRVRERFFARELEAGFAIVTRNVALPFDEKVRVRLFAVVGNGITNDGSVSGHFGLALRALPIVGVDWVTVEAGVRTSVVRDVLHEGSVAISMFFDPLD